MRANCFFTWQPGVGGQGLFSPAGLQGALVEEGAGPSPPHGLGQGRKGAGAGSAAPEASLQAPGQRQAVTGGGNLSPEASNRTARSSGPRAWVTSALPRAMVPENFHYSP